MSIKMVFLDAEYASFNAYLEIVVFKDPQHWVYFSQLLSTANFHILWHEYTEIITNKKLSASEQSLWISQGYRSK